MNNTTRKTDGKKRLLKAIEAFTPNQREVWAGLDTDEFRQSEDVAKRIGHPAEATAAALSTMRLNTGTVEGRRVPGGGRRIEYRRRTEYVQDATRFQRRTGGARKAPSEIVRQQLDVIGNAARIIQQQLVAMERVEKLLGSIKGLK